MKDFNRKDNKYDYLIVLDYNMKKSKEEKEVQIFLSY